MPKKPKVKKSGDAGKRLNSFEHCLLRPDLYIGSVITTTKKAWIYKDPEVIDANDEDDVSTTERDDCTDEGEEGSGESPESKSKDDGTRVIFKTIKYNPGLVSIIREIISNAIDNLWRSKDHGVVMKYIKIALDRDETSPTFGWITVENDGYCIPVQKTEYVLKDYRTKKTITEELYPAEMFFGEMLAGTNFEDDSKRKTSGKNGMGAKAAVVFSKEVVVDHTNPVDRKRFVQRYHNNGRERDEPEITSLPKEGKGSTGYTSFSFLPDYEYFGYNDKMDDDLFYLLKRMIVECAMIVQAPAPGASKKSKKTKPLNVTLNGEKIVVKGLAKYVRMVYPDTKENAMITFVAPNGDECVLVEKGFPKKEEEDDISQISWINGINTRDGGIHVEAWRDLLFPMIVKEFNADRKKKKGNNRGLTTSAKKLYPYFTLFVRAEVAGAAFDTQTKERLNGPEIILADAKKMEPFRKELKASIAKILKWNFAALLEEKLAMLAERSLKGSEKTKSGTRLAFGSKARDANFAGKKRKDETRGCVTEGLSAKTFADCLGSPDFYGSFALKGVPISVRRNSVRKVLANAEVKLLKQFFGFVSGVDYTKKENQKLLRYGEIWVITDQDYDGIHIKGLFLDLLYKWWPSLFELKTKDGSPYVKSFTTAVVVATKGKKGTSSFAQKLFYSNVAFKEWYEPLSTEDRRGWTIKYYKGLGTHKDGSEKMYLDDPHIINYLIDDSTEQAMELGFETASSKQRQKWIVDTMHKYEDSGRDDFISRGDMALSQFVDKQLIIFDIMTLDRSIPSLIDGLKNGQRKALYGVATDPDARNGKTECLENLIGSVKKTTGFHHSGASLEGTMKGMAQGFVGSNNIPLFQNDGKFGTRHAGGKNAAAARYIATGLEEIVSSILDPLDEPLLTRDMEDDKLVEYKFYVPVIPLILVNGADGMATGFSTKVAQYNPTELCDRIDAWLDNVEQNSYQTEYSFEDFPLLKPWYRNFTGEIELVKKDVRGKDAVCEPGDTPTAWISKGVLEKQKKGGKEMYVIKELPIGLWTDKMKTWLEYLWTGTPPEGSKKKKGERKISEPRWLGTSNTVYWEFKAAKGFVPSLDTIGNLKDYAESKPSYQHASLGLSRIPCQVRVGGSDSQRVLQGSLCIL